MDIPQIESVFLYFYSKRDWYLYFEEIQNDLNHLNLKTIELQAIIQKLVKDGYLSALLFGVVCRYRKRSVAPKNIARIHPISTIHSKNR